MSFDWIKRLAQPRLLPDDFDFSEAHIGCDFSLSPEILGFLTEKISSEKLVSYEDHADKAPLILDEHEMALG
jgi:hypothetical protein